MFDALGVLPIPVGTGAGLAGGVARAGAMAFFDAAASWVVHGSMWILREVGAVITSTTAVQLDSGWFKSHYTVMASIGAAVIVPMACAGALQAIYRQNASALVRSFLVHLPLALLLTAVGVEVVRMGLQITDTLSNQVMASAGIDAKHFLLPIAKVLSPIAPFALLAFGLIIAAAGLVLWMELAVRAAAVSLAVLFLPIALAGLVWPAVSHWARRLAEVIAALVLSKLVVACAISLSAGALTGGLSSLVTGAALLVLAVFSPFALLRLIPAIEGGMVSHMEVARHRVIAVSASPVHAYRFAQDVVADHGSSMQRSHDGQGMAETRRALRSSSSSTTANCRNLTGSSGDSASSSSSAAEGMRGRHTFITTRSLAGEGLLHTLHDAGLADEQN